MSEANIEILILTSLNFFIFLHKKFALLKYFTYICIVKILKNMQTVKTTIEEKTIIDKETGEVLDTQVTSNKEINFTRKVKNYNEFIMVYLEDISSFLKIENATQIKVLALI